jgi:hypothetical protein
MPYNLLFKTMVIEFRDVFEVKFCVSQQLQRQLCFGLPSFWQLRKWKRISQPVSLQVLFGLLNYGVCMLHVQKMKEDAAKKAVNGSGTAPVPNVQGRKGSGLPVSEEA